ncbi:MAG TPA: polyprenyl synthetase family protein [Kiritimatiellia bacterium]|nr:polyprenyl synthetase family protein [Kiritimatiellia bacterium]
MSGSDQVLSPVAGLDLGDCFSEMTREWLVSTFSAEGLARLHGEQAEELSPRRWEEAIQGMVRYFLSRPGKCFRARMVAMSWESMANGKPMPKMLPALVELLHAGSLIVDDIQDDAVSRRGAPSLHRVYGTPLALNSGNWLYFWPSVLIRELPVDEACQLRLHRELAETMLSCHHGQALDLSQKVSSLAQGELGKVARLTAQLKTGRLIGFGAAMGAIAAGGDEASIGAFRRFGCEVGVGLQMLDDLGALRAESRREKAREDLLHGRLTWPWILLSESMSVYEYSDLVHLSRQVVSQQVSFEVLRVKMLEGLPEDAPSRIRNHFQEAFDRLRGVVPGSQAVERFESELRALEKSYG